MSFPGLWGEASSVAVAMHAQGKDAELAAVRGTAHGCSIDPPSRFVPQRRLECAGLITKGLTFLLMLCARYRRGVRDHFQWGWKLFPFSFILFRLPPSIFYVAAFLVLVADLIFVGRCPYLFWLLPLFLLSVALIFLGCCPYFCKLLPLFLLLAALIFIGCCPYFCWGLPLFFAG